MANKSKKSTLMTIKKALITNREIINNLYLAVFDSEENKLVANLATDLLDDKNSVSFIYESDNKIIGHIAFSEVKIKTLKAYILAPLGVLPQYQNKGIGTKLVSYGINYLKNLDVKLLFVYGDPNYYKKFNFIQTSDFILDYNLTYPNGFQVLTLNNYQINFKEKLKLDFVKPLQNQELW